MLPRSSHLRHPSLRQHYVSKYLHMALSSKNRIYFIPLLARKCSGKSQIRSNSPWESLTRFCLPIEVPHIVSWIQVRHGLPQRYLASHITIEVSSNYKDLWKFIKLFKLMFWAEPGRDGGYRIDLDGPISPFVSSTLRYGRQLASFLPALLLCERWRMQAYVRPPQAKGETLYRLDHTCSLRSHFKSSGMFDSRLEA